MATSDFNDASGRVAQAAFRLIVTLDMLEDAGDFEVMRMSDDPEQKSRFDQLNSARLAVAEAIHPDINQKGS